MKFCISPFDCSADSAMNVHVLIIKVSKPPFLIFLLVSLQVVTKSIYLHSDRGYHGRMQKCVYRLTNYAH